MFWNFCCISVFKISCARAFVPIEASQRFCLVGQIHDLSCAIVVVTVVLVLVVIAIVVIVIVVAVFVVLHRRWR